MLYIFHVSCNFALSFFCSQILLYEETIRKKYICLKKLDINFKDATIFHTKKGKNCGKVPFQRLLGKFVGNEILFNLIEVET